MCKALHIKQCRLYFKTEEDLDNFHALVVNNIKVRHMSHVSCGLEIFGRIAPFHNIFYFFSSPPSSSSPSFSPGLRFIP